MTKMPFRQSAIDRRGHGAVSNRVDKYLHNFKQLVEAA